MDFDTAIIIQPRMSEINKYVYPLYMYDTKKLMKALAVLITQLNVDIFISFCMLVTIAQSLRIFGSFDFGSVKHLYKSEIEIAF